MGKRFAIVIGVAAAGLMALGAQTTAAPYDVYHTTVTIEKERGEGRNPSVHGRVKSEVRKCERRRVILTRDAPRVRINKKVGFDRSRIGLNGEGVWTVPKSSLKLQRGWYSLRAKVKLKGRPRDGFVCGANISETIRVFVR